MLSLGSSDFHFWFFTAGPPPSCMAAPISWRHRLGWCTASVGPRYWSFSFSSPEQSSFLWSLGLFSASENQCSHSSLVICWRFFCRRNLGGILFCREG